MSTFDYSKVHRIHCVGVGGIGLSALARLFHSQGREVTGCDRDPSIVTEGLLVSGISIVTPNSASHVSKDIDLLIYSDAVGEESPERQRAQELGIPQLSYFEALGKIANQSHSLIAVSGTHGKTTTTAMLTDVLEAAGLNPTAVVGSLRAKTKSNFCAGDEEYFVVEADEYRRHFLQFSPKILLITNIDTDHLDYYKDIADIQSAFRDLAHKVPHDGFVVCNAADEKIRPVISDLSCTVIDYLNFFDPNLPLNVLLLNRINAAAVMAVANILNIDSAVAKKALADFTGTWRRFEYKGKTKHGALVYDDYAHHPAEIEATLGSIRRQFPDKKIIVAFHPHLYSRTKILFDEFVHAFDLADEIIIAPIFAAREEPDPSISNHVLAEQIATRGKNVHALDSFDAIENYLKEDVRDGDLVVTMGAGDIYKVAEKITI